MPGTFLQEMPDSHRAALLTFNIPVALERDGRVLSQPPCHDNGSGQCPWLPLAVLVQGDGAVDLPSTLCE